MARKILDIYDAIIEEKQTLSSLDGLHPVNENSTQLLNDLNSDSKVAVWRLWAYITAVAIHVHEVYFDLFIHDAKKIIDTAATGTAAWYQRKILDFQYGDSLTYTDGKYIYSPIVEANRIISRCSIEERSDGIVMAKVVKQEPPVKLIEAERLALESYLHKIKFAGTRIGVVSLNADALTPNYDIYYDPIIPLSEVQADINLKVADFLENLPFNGKFNITKFTDALQRCKGVLDPVVSQVKVKPFGGTDITVNNEFTPASGYVEMSDTIDNLFTFIPKV